MEKVAVAPAATLPPAAVKPAGRFVKSIATVPANPEIGTTCTTTRNVPPGTVPTGFVADVAGVTLNEKSLITFRKSVAVRVMRKLEVPRTVIRAGPGTAAALIEREKEPGVPAVKLPELTENPAGRFGKSMTTVPVNPVPATICTVTGSVLFCVTGAGELEVVTGVTLMLKSG